MRCAGVCELARLTGVSRFTIRRILTGRSGGSDRVLKALGDAGLKIVKPKSKKK